MAAESIHSTMQVRDCDRRPPAAQGYQHIGVCALCEPVPCRECGDGAKHDDAAAPVRPCRAAPQRHGAGHSRQCAAAAVHDLRSGACAADRRWLPEGLPRCVPVLLALPVTVLTSHPRNSHQGDVTCTASQPRPSLTQFHQLHRLGVSPLACDRHFGRRGLAAIAVSSATIAGDGTDSCSDSMWHSRCTHAVQPLDGAKPRRAVASQQVDARWLAWQGVSWMSCVVSLTTWANSPFSILAGCVTHTCFSMPWSRRRSVRAIAHAHQLTYCTPV